MHDQDGLPRTARMLAFTTVALAIIVAVLDGAIMNIALPPIRRELGISAVDAIWIVNAYQLAVTMTLLPLASLGEIWGYRRVYLAGLALFTLMSLACALSTSLWTLVAARALQGLGAAGIMSVNIALIRFIYPRAMLGRAVGNVALIVSASAATGPSIGAAILSVAPWQGLFLVNVPIGLLALAVGWKTLPATPLSGRRFDVISALMSAATFGLVISGVNGLGHAEGLAVALGQVALGLAIGIVFVRRQLGMPAPLLPVDLLRKPVFGLSVATSVLTFSAQGMAFVSLPFFLHDTLGLTPAQVGLVITPWPIATAIAAYTAGRLSDRLPPVRLSAFGLCLFTAGLIALALTPADVTVPDLIWRLVLAGLGFGIFQSPNNRVMISSAPRERSGSAGGVQSSARLVGQSLGVALLAVIFSLAPANQNAVAFTLAALLAGAGIVPSLLRRMEQGEEAGAAPKPAGG